VIREEIPKPGNQAGNIYVILDAKSAKEDRVHVNRLVQYHPWDDNTASTSEDIDERPTWKTAGTVPIGELFMFELGGAYTVGVARRLKRGSQLDGEDESDIVFQWLGNPTYNLREPIFNGWIPRRNQNSSNVQPALVKYVEEPLKSHQAQYMGSNAGIKLGSKDILVHSFMLTMRGRIPAGVRRIVAHRLEAQKAGELLL